MNYLLAVSEIFMRFMSSVLFRIQSYCVLNLPCFHSTYSSFEVSFYKTSRQMVDYLWCKAHCTS